MYDALLVLKDAGQVIRIPSTKKVYSSSNVLQENKRGRGSCETTTFNYFGPNSPPMSMMQMEKIFSASVLAHTLPKPTLVRLLRVKYSEAM